MKVIDDIYLLLQECARLLNVRQNGRPATAADAALQLQEMIERFKKCAETLVDPQVLQVFTGIDVNTSDEYEIRHALTHVQAQCIRRARNAEASRDYNT